MKIISKYLDDALLVAGGALISYGTFQIYTPAGYIVTGICLIALAFLLANGGE